MRKPIVGFLFDLMFRPYLVDLADLTEDDLLVLGIADYLQKPPEYVLEVASRECGIIFTIEDYTREGELPPMLRLWLRGNSPCPEHQTKQLKQLKSKKPAAYRKLKNRGADIINFIRGHPKQR